ncbi:hypothetical protein [Haliea atlantica]
MQRWIGVLALAGLAASQSQAGFFDELVNAVEQTAKDTAKQVVVQTTSQMVRDMIIGYTIEQVRSDDEVAEDYRREHGDLPVNTRVSSYRTEIQPGTSVSPGTEVKVRSWIEVVPGRSGDKPVIEERLTIWDNEDNSVALKSMTKAAGKRGGAFSGEFTFALPEGLPQGVYPVSTDLMLNGEQVGDQKHGLQLVLQVNSLGEAQLLALAP